MKFMNTKTLKWFLSFSFIYLFVCLLVFFSISDFQLRIFRKDTEQCGLEQSQHRDNEHLPRATRAFSRRRFSVPREDALSRAVRDRPAFGARVATPSPWSTAPGVGGSWPLTFRGIGKSPGEQRPLLLSVAPSALGRCRLCGRRGRGGRNMLAPPGRDAAWKPARGPPRVRGPTSAPPLGALPSRGLRVPAADGRWRASPAHATVRTCLVIHSTRVRMLYNTRNNDVCHRTYAAHTCNMLHGTQHTLYNACTCMLYNTCNNCMYHRIHI